MPTGLIFFVPLLGLAIGVATGALSGSAADVGIDDDLIDSVKAQVVPGTSALFVMSSDAVLDKVKEAFSDSDAELIHTTVSNDQEADLLHAGAIAVAGSACRMAEAEGGSEPR